MTKRFLCCFLSVSPLLSFAGMDVSPTDTTVKPGVWCGNFPAAKTYAENNGLPFVLVWGNTTQQHGECEFCKALTDALKTPSALAWAKAENAVFCFVGGKESRDTSPNEGALEFASTAGGVCSAPPMGYPYVCLYWPAAVDKPVTFTGRLSWMYSTEGSDLFSQFKNSYDMFVAQADVTPSCTAFPFGDAEDDRLEAEIGKTTWVDIPVVRTNNLGLTVKTRVVFACGAVTSTVELDWQGGETAKTIRYTLPAAFSSAKTATATLKDRDGSTLATRHVTGVTTAANSPKNPLWMTESAAIGYGTWSMDIDAVTNYVARSGGYAMVLFGGSLWCPDCEKTDTYFFGDSRFKQWAKDRKVVFGVIDVPRDPSDTTSVPCLLDYRSGPSGFGTPVKSGTSYLSRKMAEASVVEKVVARNKTLAGNDATGGGWNTPDRIAQGGSKAARPGVPILVLLRKDGSVAGRFTTFATTSPTSFKEAYLTRLDELLAQAGTGFEGEEANDDVKTTRDVIATTGEVTASVSHVDAYDVYRIAATEPTRTVFRIGGEARVPFSLTVTDASGAVVETLASAQGTLADGICVTALVSNAKCYVTVARLSDAAFAVDSAASTVKGYTLSTSGALSGGEITFSQPEMEIHVGGGAQRVKQVPIRVTRRRGAAGTVSVRLSLAEGRAAAGNRIAWTDDTLNWGKDEPGEKSLLLTVYDDEEPSPEVRLRFVLSDLQAEASGVAFAQGGDTMIVTLKDDDVHGDLAYRNFKWTKSIQIDDWKEGAVVSIRKTAGALPSGLSIKVVEGELQVRGTPTRNGEYDASYVVTVRDGSQVLGQQAVNLAYTVREADFSEIFGPAQRSRTYYNLPLVSGSRLAGVLTLTVPASGRLSAKCRTATGTLVYASTSWDELTPDGAARACLTQVGGADTGLALEVEISAAGGELVLSSCCEAPQRIPLPAADWSATDSAKAWSGQYTVQLPQSEDGMAARPSATGSAYMALRMVTASAWNRGAMLFAGVLPNGRPLSGTAIVRAEGESALMPFVQSEVGGVAPFAVSGELCVKANAAMNYKQQRWSVTASVPVCWSDGFGSADFVTYGGYYDKDEISEMFKQYDNPDDFCFHADTGSLVSGRYGAGALFAPVAATVANNVPSLVPDDVPVTLQFSPETGVISGVLVIPFAGGGSTAVTYRGIALPGWQACEACTGFTERPWAVGACSFADRDTEGPFRNGCEIKLDRMEGSFE